MDALPISKKTNDDSGPDSSDRIAKAACQLNESITCAFSKACVTGWPKMLVVYNHIPKT